MHVSVDMNLVGCTRLLLQAGANFKIRNVEHVEPFMQQPLKPDTATFWRQWRRCMQIIGAARRGDVVMLRANLADADRDASGAPSAAWYVGRIIAVDDEEKSYEVRYENGDHGVKVLESSARKKGGGEICEPEPSRRRAAWLPLYESNARETALQLN